MKITRRTLPPPKEYAIDELMSVADTKDRAKMWATLEERVTTTVAKGQLETLFHCDGLTFREVYDYVDFVVGPGFYFEGKSNLVKICETWSRKVKLKRISEEIVKDILVAGAGNGWVELGYNQAGNNISGLRILNPKIIDYIRDETRNKNVELDDNREPVGYKREKSGLYRHDMEWREDSISSNGKAIWTKKGNQDGRDRIAHFKLFGLGESYLGQSPLETVYKQAIIRLNLEDNVGETGYRGGGIVATIGREGSPPPTPETINKVVTDLQNISTQTIFGFPPDVKLDSFPTPDLKGREELIVYFASVQSVGMGIPLTRHLMPTMGRLAAKVSTSTDIDFERRIMAMQDRLAEQIREKLLFRMLKAQGKVKDQSEVPLMFFRSRAPNILRETINMLSRLGRRDLVRRDPQLEKKIREELGLPTDFVDKELEIWNREGRIPESPKKKSDINIDEQILDEIVERIEEAIA